MDTNPTQRTSLTEKAHALAWASLKVELEEGAGYDVTSLPYSGILVVNAHGYVTHVVGQSSAGGHGKQGLRPDTIALMREHNAEGVPQRVVFVDHGGNKWQAVWIDRDEPPIHNIDNDTAHRRVGWKVNEMERGEGIIPFPTEAPEPGVPAQEGLL